MSPALTPLPAVAAELEITGGQALTQAPVQVDFDPVSDANSYSDLPEPSVR
jgi:hypothetical protein